MDEVRREIAGLACICVGDPSAERAVVFLHGREMMASDLSPFAKSLGAPAYFVFPDAPVPVQPRGFAWFPVDSERRARALQGGPMQLHELYPDGRPEARAKLRALLETVAAERPFLLAGFSQGGMLAMDYLLCGEGPRPEALALLSSTRIAWRDWEPHLPRLAGLPVLVAHGHADQELAFAAGEGLRDAVIAGGAKVTWLPFEGGHDLPLVVWRALRRMLRAAAE
ncbi:MAG TPA: hypothetical protein VGM88_09415 [Kofleriaceae bacterium]|jgi:phospholipase/carboxylesterase